KVCGPRILHENKKREAIAYSYSFTAISEVACEFNERRRGPSHLYLKAAPPAPRIFEPQCKTSFATQSGVKQTSAGRRPMSPFDPQPHPLEWRQLQHLWCIHWRR